MAIDVLFCCAFRNLRYYGINRRRYYTVRSALAHIKHTAVVVIGIVTHGYRLKTRWEIAHYCAYRWRHCLVTTIVWRIIYAVVIVVRRSVY